MFFDVWLFQAIQDGETCVHLYTELESYKKLGANAPPALSCAFYTDLMEEKGIVLMRGQVSGKAESCF